MAAKPEVLKPFLANPKNVVVGYHAGCNDGFGLVDNLQPGMNASALTPVKNCTCGSEQKDVHCSSKLKVSYAWQQLVHTYARLKASQQ